MTTRPKTLFPKISKEQRNRFENNNNHVMKKKKKSGLLLN